MRFTLPDLPIGWPWSLWFFIITVVVYLLQRFPLTGVFLMILAAALWSVVLINLGMLGITVEVVTGKVSPLWLAVPLLYFGGYYAAYANDQSMFAKLRQETVRFNAGKALPFDPSRQDLLVDIRTDGLGVTASDLAENYDVPRAFDNRGRVWLVATKEVCTLVNSDHGFMTAGIQARMITRQGKRRFSSVGTGYCLVMMPGKPDKPAVAITQNQDDGKRGLLPVSLTTLIASDSASGQSATVRTGRAAPLKRFPMWMMGCALDSGTPAWRCFHGFMRENSTQILPDMPRYSSGTPIIARVLGLRKSDDFAKRAMGIEMFQPIADRIDAGESAREVAILEKMLAAPDEYIRDGWLYHLPNRPGIVAPYAGRIFDALEALQSWERDHSDNGRNLATLVSNMSDETLAPFHARLVELMNTAAARPWITDTPKLYTRLDVADPRQRDIVLDRLTLEKRSFPAELLPPFCKMGTSAPEDAKQRLLALWRARTPDQTNKGWGTKRDRIDVILYLTLARMGLKQEAGPVEQQYMGPDFRDIWAHVTPDTPEEICTGDPGQVSTYFRKSGIRA